MLATVSPHCEAWRAFGTDSSRGVGCAGRGGQDGAESSKSCCRVEYARGQSDKDCDVDRTSDDPGRVRQFNAACCAGDGLI